MAMTATTTGIHRLRILITPSRDRLGDARAEGGTSLKGSARYASPPSDDATTRPPVHVVVGPRAGILGRAHHRDVAVSARDAQVNPGHAAGAAGSAGAHPRRPHRRSDCWPATRTAGSRTSRCHPPPGWRTSRWAGSARGCDPPGPPPRSPPASPRPSRPPVLGSSHSSFLGRGEGTAEAVPSPPLSGSASPNPSPAP